MHFSLQPAPMPDLTAEQYFPPEYAVEAIADAQLKWRLIEDFGPDCFETRADGTLFVHGVRSDLDGLIAWALTYGDRIQILKPLEARSRLLAIAKGIQSIYEEEALP